MKQNKLQDLFAIKQKKILNMYCTAGFPTLQSTDNIILSLQQAGADIVELGMPFSDPIADGPVIQKSNMLALSNGIDISTIFSQLAAIKNQLKVPIVLMGYLNPVIQYGFEKFCEDAAAAGVSGLILPDMPMEAFDKWYGAIIKKNNLCFTFLITPLTSPARIKQLDKRSSGFLYAVSASATTGAEIDFEAQQKYFERLSALKLKNKVLIGFGIKDHASFEHACNYAAGAIIGSAFINALAEGRDDEALVTEKFVAKIRQAETSI